MRVLRSDEILDKLRECVSQAEREILISSAWITHDGINKLRRELEGLDRSVNIRVLIRAQKPDDLKITKNEAFMAFRDLKNRNIKVKVRAHPNLHAKFVVVDDKYAIVGSANITHDGLSPHGGNEEVCVFLDDSKEIQRLTDIFDDLWNEAYETEHEGIVGIISNPSKSSTIEIFVLGNDLKEGMYVTFEHENRKYIAQVISMMSWNTAFFMNPFTQQPNTELFPPVEDLKLLFEGSRDPSWQITALKTFLTKDHIEMTIARAKVLGYIDDDGALKPPFSPPSVGTLVFKASERDVHALYGILADNERKRAQVGVFSNTDIGFYIDLEEIRSKHLAVIGTTGSGKSYFVKKLISESVGYFDKIYILDPHGEYKEDLVKVFGVPEDLIEEIAFDNILFVTDDDQLRKKILEPYGLKTPNELSDIVNKVIKYWVFSAQGLMPADLLREIISKRKQTSLMDFNNTSKDDEISLEEMSIVDCLMKAVENASASDISKGKNKKDVEELRRLKENMMEDLMVLKEMLKSIFSEENMTYGKVKKAFESIENSLNSDRKIVIYNLKNVSEPMIRVEIAGVVLRKVYEKAKCEQKRTLLVLEEAHSFAPEKTYGDVSASKKENKALVYSQKIAAEGRKFGLGLVVVTQRPAQISKYVLSQMNTYAIFRVVNRGDLDAIESAVESISRDIIERLSDLRTGYAFITGVGAILPAFIEVK